ncbi:MAG: hypothetical protein IJB88_08090 [Clostridia bacterium]|nr:hypothetical protein [Clostridia bacterium]MBQ3155178.1 hypothetical protein [Clostridia bacterium]
MFRRIYCNTTKNILRSKSFWLFLLVYLALVISEYTEVFEWYHVNSETMEQIFYRDPRFIFDYQSYVKEFCDAFAIFLKYASPLLAVVTTASIVAGDYSDHLFEIEKAGGINTRKYVLARIAAITVINCVVVTIFSALWYHLTITAKGVEGMTLFEILAGSTYRLLLNSLLRVVPCVLFHVCLTYAVGTFVKHSATTSAICMAYVIANYVYDARFNVADKGIYVRYLIPTDPRKLMDYLYYFDSEWFEWMIETFDTSLGDALLALSVMLGSAVIFCTAAYLRTRKRSL